VIGFSIITNFAGEQDKNSPGLKLHSNSPEFSLYSLEGDHIKLSDDAGIPVIINFWATWCGPCVIEMPLLQERYDHFKPNLAVLAVNAGESKESVRKFITENNLTFPVLIDPTRSVQKLYQVRAYPTTYFIDGDGTIQAVHIGVLSQDELDKYLSEIGVIDG
jgi:peroxiredoxin